MVADRRAERSDPCQSLPDLHNEDADALDTAADRRAEEADRPTEEADRPAE